MLSHKPLLTKRISLSSSPPLPTTLGLTEGLGGLERRELVITIYSYSAIRNDELSFTEGQIIRVIKQVDGGWAEGQVGDYVGWFPTNHVAPYPIQDEDRKSVV